MNVLRKTNMSPYRVEIVYIHVKNSKWAQTGIILQLYSLDRNRTYASTKLLRC